MGTKVPHGLSWLRLSRWRTRVNLKHEGLDVTTPARTAGHMSSLDEHGRHELEKELDCRYGVIAVRTAPSFEPFRAFYRFVRDLYAR